MVDVASTDEPPAETHGPAGERGWFSRPGDPNGVQRWHDGAQWTDMLKGGTASQQAAAQRLVTPSTAEVVSRPVAAQPEPRGFRPDAYRSLGYGERSADPYRLPGQVSAASVLEFVNGGFSILGALLFLALGSVVGAFALIGVLLLLIGGLEIWVGVALRQLQTWARVTAILIAVLSGLLSLVSLLGGNFLSLVGFGLDVAIIVLLGQRAASIAFDG